MITGSGFDAARIMLVMDGGSEDDKTHNTAITGYQESEYRKYCSANGIQWTDVYKTLLIKERINLMKPEENIPLLTDKYKEILYSEINSIAPNVIVPLSELSFNYLTGLSKIRKYRGSVLPCALPGLTKITRCIPILGLYPYISQDATLHFITRLDFSKVAKNINNDGPIKTDGNLWVAKNATEVRDFFNRSYAKCEYLVFDIETYVGVPTCISFCFDGNESVTVPILDWHIPHYERAVMAGLVAKLLASPLPKVNQNIKFDWKRLEKFLFQVENVQGDTLLAAACIYPEFPKNLGFLTSIYTDMPYHKDEGKEFNPTTKNRNTLYLYCAKDSLATHRIYSKQKTELKELGSKRVYDTLIEILPIYKRMEQRGIRIDEEKRRILGIKYNTLYDMQVQKLRQLCNKEVNPLSHKQAHDVIYEELKYKAVRGVKKTKAGNPSTDEESLEILLWTGASPYVNAKLIINTWIACRKIHKVMEYLETPIHPDGRMRCEFNLAGTENLRTTASEYTEGMLQFDKKKVQYVNLGRSFQTLAKHGFSLDGEDLGKDLRSMFVPSSGYSFVELDLSQAEARVDAVLADDINILSIFDGPIGIHRLTGSWLYGCDPSEIKKNILVNGVDRYHEAKTARHAGERNMGADRLMMMIRRPIADCNNILTRFHDNQPNIRRIFHQQIAEVLQKERCLISPHGFRRDFFSKYDKHMINEGISFIPQATVTFVLKSALKKTFDEFPDACPLSEAHDGFLSEVPIGREQEFASIFKRNVEQPIDFRKCSLSRDYQLTIPSESEYSSENWMELKKIEL